MTFVTRYKPKPDGKWRWSRKACRVDDVCFSVLFLHFNFIWSCFSFMCYLTVIIPKPVSYLSFRQKTMQVKCIDAVTCASVYSYPFRLLHTHNDMMRYTTIPMEWCILSMVGWHLKRKWRRRESMKVWLLCYVNRTPKNDMKWIVIEQIEVEDEGRKIEKMSGRAGRRSRNVMMISCLRYTQKRFCKIVI